MTTASHESATATAPVPVPALLPLSPMDAVMSGFDFTILYIFPPPSSSSASGDNSVSGANTSSSASTKTFDLERLHSSFQALVEEEYRVLLGELHVHPTTGVVSVQQTPEWTQRGAARAIPFDKSAAHDGATTEDAMQSRSMAFMPSRTPTQPVTVKATLLRDGGLALGVNMSHTLLDGEGMFTFMAVWGEFYRGVAPHERTVVHHDRSLLAGRGIGARLPHPEFKLRAPVSESVTNASEPVTTGSEPVIATAPPTTTQHVFHISPTMMQQIKAVGMGAGSASSGDDSGEDGSTGTTSYVSTIDAVTALFILLITQARGHGQSVRFTTGVNARKRFSPPLPEHYVGNVIFNALSTYDAHELTAVSADAVRAVARRVRQSILRRDDAFLRDAIEFVTAHANLADVLVGTDFFFGPDLMFTSWVHFGMYDADFGATPWFVGPPRLPLLDGMVVVMEAMRGAAGLDLVVLLESNAMARLLELWEQVSFWK